VSRPSAWDRWIALLLLAYPKRFRDRFGRDLALQYPSPGCRSFRAAVTAAHDLLRAGLGARVDDLRRAWGHRTGGGLDALRTDVAHAVRGLARRPLYAALVITTLALAASLNVAVFAIVDQTLLRSLPYPEEARLVAITNMWTGYPHSSISLPEYEDYRTRARSFESIAVYSNTSLNLAPSGGTAERIQGTVATASFFEVLAGPAMLGRTYTDEEDTPGARVVVLSHAFWLRRFGADPGAVGGALHFDDGARTIVGVMPDGWEFPSPLTDVWIPMNRPGDAGSRGAHTRQVIARVERGVPVARARDEMHRIAAQLQQEYPDAYPAGSGWNIEVSPLRDRMVGDLRPALLMLMIAALFVQLIACANVANVIVARTAERSRDIATRLAFGAAWFRLVRQGCLEGLIAGALGGLAGLLLAAWLLVALEPWLPQDLPRPEQILTDSRVAGFALLATGLAGALSAALTTLRAPMQATAETLRGTRATAESERARAALTAAQVAVAVALLTCGGFAMRSFVRLVHTDPGVQIAQVATARVALSSVRYPNAASRAAFFGRLQDALERQPGVRGAGAISLLPLSGDFSDWTFGVEHASASTSDLEPSEQARVVHGDYFSVMGIPVRTGRAFSSSDTAEAPRVAIVSELLAKKYWKDGGAVGRRIKLWGVDSDQPWATVVGIVADIRHRAVEEAPVPILYFPAGQAPFTTMTVLARLDPGNPHGSRVIADAVRAIDPEQPTWLPRMMEQWFAQSVAQPRFNLVLLSLFASLAVLLASVGVFGVTSFTVTRRTRELGIRIALGARPRALMREVLGDALWLATLGTAIGGALALIAGRYLGSVLYDLRIADPVVLAGVPALVCAVALVASYVPARRAMRVDPVVALRAE
jgi:putative ABC transport system permease protein